MKMFIKLICLSILISAPAHAMQNDADLGRQLFIAAGDSDLQEIKRLISAGASVDYIAEDYDMTPMQAVIEYGYQKPKNSMLCLKAFIDAEAQINLANRAGATALVKAAFLDNQQACELLIDAMLRIPSQKQKAGMTTFLGIKSRKTLFPYILDGYLRKQFKTLWPIMVYENNKQNFASSVAYQELMRVKDLPQMQGPESKELIAALFEKYNPGASNIESRSWCSVQ